MLLLLRLSDRDFRSNMSNSVQVFGAGFDTVFMEPNDAIESPAQAEAVQPRIRRRMSSWAWFLIGFAVLNVSGTVLVGAAAYLFTYLPQQMAEIPTNDEWKSLSVNQLPFYGPKDFRRAQRRLRAKAFTAEGLQDPIPRLLLGDLFHMMNEDRAAIFFYEDTLKRIEANWLNRIIMGKLAVQAHENLALLYYQQGQNNAALSEINAISDVETEAENPALLMALKDCLENPERGNFHLALARELKYVMELPFADWETQQAIKLAKSDWLKTQAVAYQQTAIPRERASLNPLARYYILAGNWKADQHDDATAERFYEKAVFSSPQFEWGYNSLAIVQQNQRKFEQAKASAQKAIALNPNFYNPHLILGDIAIEQKAYDEALRHYANGLKIISEMPDDEWEEVPFANVFNQMAYALESQGKPEKATYYYALSLRQFSEDDDLENDDYTYAQAGLARTKSGRHKA